MKTIGIGILDAKRRFSELLEKASRGQRILITRRGLGIAVLSAPDSGSSRPGAAKSGDLLARLRHFRALARGGGESIKALIEEGRR